MKAHGIRITFYTNCTYCGVPVGHYACLKKTTCFDCKMKRRREYTKNWYKTHKRVHPIEEENTEFWEEARRKVAASKTKSSGSRQRSSLR